MLACLVNDTEALDFRIEDQMSVSNLLIWGTAHVQQS